LRAGVADRSLRLSPRLSISRYLIERWVAATTGSVLTQ